MREESSDCLQLAVWPRIPLATIDAIVAANLGPARVRGNAQPNASSTSMICFDSLLMRELIDQVTDRVLARLEFRAACMHVCWGRIGGPEFSEMVVSQRC